MTSQEFAQELKNNFAFNEPIFTDEILKVFSSYSRAQVFRYVDIAKEDNVLDFIVYLKDNCEPIGNITLDRYDEKLKSLEVSINIHPSYWKKGYATEAILCALRYVFDNLDIDNIIYGYADDNYKSKGLSDKLEFKFYTNHTEHYTRINKDVLCIETIMSKERFNELYGNK